MPNFPIYVVDAFPTGNNGVFTGGPAAIVILQYDDEIPDESKQRLATSMNLSETAFVSLALTKTGNENLTDKIDENKSIRRTLRWFNPKSEVQLCGHATQAAAKALLKHYQIQSNTDQVVIERIEFQSRFKGILTATLKNENGAELITIGLPTNLTIPVDISKAPWAPNFLKSLLGPSFQDPVASVQELQESPTMANYLLVRLRRIAGESPQETLLKVNPNLKEVAEADTGNVQGQLHIVTIEGEEGSGPDLFCRIFAPYMGVPEDPVCGSAQTLLVPYWTQELQKEGQELKIRQLSRRGGQFLGLLNGFEVALTGTARVVIVGELKL